jgi:dTDP-4-dehydrorhamnose reductase
VNEKVLITGGTGLLGSDLITYFRKDSRPMGVSTKDFDITDADATMYFFRKMEPHIVLHAAGMVNVDQCEEDKNMAMAINADGAENVARACREVGARMVYYSTDYVFDGTKGKPYVETDEPDPINVYGQSKLEGEKRVIDIKKDAVIIRISWLFGTGRDCFVTSLLKKGRQRYHDSLQGKKVRPIKVVGDQVSSPTWTLDIAEQTHKVLRNGTTGILHAVSEGESSRFELAELIFEEIAWDLELKPISSSEYPFVAKRPMYSTLENKRLKELGINTMRNYHEALREFLMVYKGND